MSDIELGTSVTGADFLSHSAGTQMSLEELERSYILEVLKKCDGHVGKAAEILKINRKTLWMKRRKYGIE